MPSTPLHPGRAAFSFTGSAEVTAARAAAVPGALGAVLDLVAAAMAALPDVVVTDMPRMAGFARVLAALDQVTGWHTLPAYRAKVASLGLVLIEGNPLAQALYRFATGTSPGGLDPAPWEGTAAQLLTVVTTAARAARIDATGFPTHTNVLGRQLSELTLLAGAGGGEPAGQEHVLVDPQAGRVQGGSGLVAQCRVGACSSPPMWAPSSRTAPSSPSAAISAPWRDRAPP